MAVSGDDLVRLAIRAGKIIMEIYDSDFAVMQKADNSAVTEADARAEALILSGLRTAEPDLVIIAEEAMESGPAPRHGHRFALVDPLDGTREFVSRHHEFTVNIAIIEHGRPVMGVVYAPAFGRIFVAESPASAWEAKALPGGDLPQERSRLTIRPAPAIGLTALCSKSHDSPETEAVLAKYPIAERKHAGSALKFCLVAAGEADLYVRPGRTMEWDTAAGQAVVEAAGGRVLALDGTPLLYGKSARGYDNPGFVVYGDVTPA